MNLLPNKPHFRLHSNEKITLDFYLRVTSNTGYPINGYTVYKLGSAYILHNSRTDQFYYTTLKVIKS